MTSGTDGLRGFLCGLERGKKSNLSQGWHILPRTHLPKAFVLPVGHKHSFQFCFIVKVVNEVGSAVEDTD